MKKVICLLMIFALSGALYAADVDFVAVQDPVDSTKVKISYVKLLGNAPAGIALIASVDSGVKITGSESQDPCFNVNPDYAYGDPCNYTLGLGHPLAEPCAPGVATVPSSEVSICMGIVDLVDSHGPTASDIITLTMDPCGATVATLRIREDAYRGGVVGSPLVTNLPIRVDLVFGPVCEFPPTHDDYAAWQAAGSPACWCYLRQCHGDTDDVYEGKDVGSRRYVVLADLNLLAAAWQKLDDVSWDPAWQCANFDHGYEGKDVGSRRYVTLPDLNILGASWQKTDDLVPADCLDVP